MEKSSKSNSIFNTQSDIPLPPGLMETEEEFKDKQKREEIVNPSGFLMPLPKSLALPEPARPLIEEHPVITEVPTQEEMSLVTSSNAELEALSLNRKIMWSTSGEQDEITDFSKGMGELQDPKGAWEGMKSGLSDIDRAIGPVGEFASTLLLGEWLGKPQNIVEAFAKGDADSIGNCLSGITEDIGYLAIDAVTLKAGMLARQGMKGGQEGLKALLEEAPASIKQLYSALDKISPRDAFKKLSTILGPLAIPLNKYRDKFWEKISYPVKARFVPTTEGRKSIGEIMQPAVDRLEKSGLDKPFRRSMANKALVSDLGKDLGKVTAHMGVEERLDLYKTLKGEGGSKESKRLLYGFGQKIKAYGIEREYAQHFRKSVFTQIGKQFELGKDKILDNAPVRELIKVLDESLGGTYKPKDVQKALDNLIENVNTPNETKLLLKDLYNLPYSTPLAVAEASKKASNKFLVSNLRRQDGVIMAGLPEGMLEKDMVAAGYLKSKYPMLKDAYVLRDVELELRALNDIPKYARSMWNRIFLTPWKTGKVILRPATHFRNMISNTILNDWGGLPFYRIDRYIEASREMKRKGKYWREWQRETGSGGTFSVAEIEQVTGGMKHGANGLDHALSVFDRMTAVPRRYYHLEEQWFKMAKYIHNRKAGMETYEAAIDAMKWTFNYGEITRSTALIRGSVAPFYTWTSKVIPLMAETAVKHPIRFGKWLGMYQGFQALGVESVGMTESEWEWAHSVMPKYIQEGAFLLMPFRDSEKRLQMLNLTYMIPGLGDMVDILTDPAGQMLGSPLITIGGGIINNTRYSGAPIWYDWEPPATRWAKGMAYMWESLMPSLVPGGTDWNQIYNTVTDTPDALTYGQIVAAQMGLKVSPIDTEKSARRKAAIDDMHRSEIGSRMRSEVRKATSPQDARKIVEHYGKLRERFEKEARGR